MLPTDFSKTCEMSQKLKEINGDASTKQLQRNGCTGQENGNDLIAKKAALTPLEYRVTQQRETERPFSNRYNKHWEAGTYHCIVCDEELFKSETKFESKSGWPAFYNVVDPQRVKLTPDLSHIGANLLLLVAKPDLARTEVSCASCNAHLGHLFKDGPKPTGLRYCINSASLNFKPEGGCSDVPDSIISPNPTVANKNGESMTAPVIREFVCKPENMCSRPSSAATTPVSVSSTSKDSFGKSARDNFFNSDKTRENNFTNAVPPMGALCLNNQMCQRVVVTKKPASSEAPKSNGNNGFVSNGVENEMRNGSNKSSIISTPSCNIDPLTSAQITSTPLSTKPRYSHSKGASLTAARINFFQKISTPQDPSIQPPSRWAATYNSRWNPDQSGSPQSPCNNTQENHTPPRTRFPSSCSSGSLCTIAQQSNSEELPPAQPPRSSSTFFSNSTASIPIPTPVERISSPPRSVALRETTL